MTKHLYLLLGVCLLAFPVKAQYPSTDLPPPPPAPATIDAPSAQMSITGQYFRPMGALADAGYRNSWGLGMNILSRPLAEYLPVNLQYGVNLSYDGHSSDNFDVMVTYPEVAEAQTWVNNAQVGAHGLLRVVTTPRFPIQLYGQIQAGGRLFLSSEAVEITDWEFHQDECPEPDRTYMQRQLGLSYGGGGGLLVRLSESTHLNLQAMQLFGGGTRFIDTESARIAEPNVIGYEMQHASQTNGWQFNMGLTFDLDDMECTPSRGDVSATNHSFIWW